MATSSFYTTPGLADSTSHENTSEEDNPSQRVHPTVEKGYPAGRVDLGWLLFSCKRLNRFDRR